MNWKINHFDWRTELETFEGRLNKTEGVLVLCVR
jgi:hypothetical protein